MRAFRAALREDKPWAIALSVIGAPLGLALLIIVVVFIGSWSIWFAVNKLPWPSWTEAPVRAEAP